jgi:hypothetical protein
MPLRLAGLSGSSPTAASAVRRKRRLDCRRDGPNDNFGRPRGLYDTTARYSHAEAQTSTSHAEDTIDGSYLG